MELVIPFLLLLGVAITTASIYEQFAGVWEVRYTNGYHDIYSITPDGQVEISRLRNRKVRIVPTVNKAPFLSKDGWFMIRAAHRLGTWEYIRINNDQLVIQHFGWGFGRKYQNKSPSYCCEGSGSTDLMRLALKGLDDVGHSLVTTWDSEKKKCLDNTGCKGEYDGTATALEQVAHGFIAGKELADGMSRVLDKVDGFHSYSQKFGKLAPFLGAVGPIVEVFSLFQNSPEVSRLETLMQMMNKGFTRMERQFTQVKHKLDDLEDLMNKLSFKSYIDSTLKEYKSIQQTFEDYFAVTHKGEREERANDMDADFYQRVKDTFYAIRDLFETTSLNDNVCALVKNFSDVNRHEVLRISIALYNRMVTTGQQLLLVGKLHNRVDARRGTRQRELIAALKMVSNKIDACDQKIASTEWLPQWHIDYDKAAESRGTVNELAKSINDVLTSKYYWRDWLVLVYGDMNGGNRHWKTVCNINEGYWENKMHWEGYIVLVTSVPKTKARHSYTLRTVTTYSRREERGYRGRKIIRYTYYDAKQIYEQLPNNVRACTNGNRGIWGVVEKSGDFVIHAPAYRKSYADVTNHKRICTGGRWSGPRKCINEWFHVFHLG